MRIFQKYIFIIFCIIFLGGCYKYGDYLYAERGCLNCNIPEATLDDKALVYVIRKAYWLNEFEHHKIYLQQGNKTEYLGINFDRTYCPGYLSPGKADVTVKWVGKDDVADKLELEVEAGKVYFIEHEVNGKFYSALVYPKLRLVSEEEGKALLRTVIGKCKK